MPPSQRTTTDERAPPAPQREGGARRSTAPLERFRAIFSHGPSLRGILPNLLLATLVLATLAILTVHPGYRSMDLAALGVGFVGGLVGGLVAGGVGLVTIPLLVLILGLPIHEALGLNLLSATVTGLSGLAAHGRRGNVDLRLAAPLAAGAVVGGTAGALASLALPATTLRWIFTVAIFIMAGYTLLRVLRNRRREVARGRPRLLPGAGALRQTLVLMSVVGGTRFQGSVQEAVGEPIEGTFRGERYAADPVTLGLAGVILGFVAGLMGVSGGFLFTPFLANVMLVPAHLAVGTGLVVLTGNALFGSLVHVAAGSVGSLLWVPLALGGYLGAQVGSRVSHHLPERALNLLFVALLLVVGLRMLPVGLP